MVVPSTFLMLGCVFLLQVFQRQLAKQGLSEALVDEVGQEVGAVTCLICGCQLLHILLQPGTHGQLVQPGPHAQATACLTAPTADVVLHTGLCSCHMMMGALLVAQVRTFSAEELRSLFKVDPTTPCDTHAAIKCSCDGSAATAAAKASAFAAARRQEAQGAEAGGVAEGAADKEQQGLAAWAHLRSAADVPDPTWGHMGDWLRDKFVTYVFSDHVLQEPKEQLVEECGGDDQEEEEEEGGTDAEQAGGELCETGKQQAVSDHESDTEPDAW